MGRRQLGARGERAAARYLEETGLTVAHRNWRCAAGEVDIVAWDGDTLVICEVKTRRSLRAGIPEEAVTREKQRRLCTLASAYVRLVGPQPARVRFDVVAVVPTGSGRAVLRHHAGAFDAPVG